MGLQKACWACAGCQDLASMAAQAFTPSKCREDHFLLTMHCICVNFASHYPPPPSQMLSMKELLS